jgi:S-DNA-T family DNA segregation ATPase FtsK/SpoIIIE
MKKTELLNTITGLFLFLLAAFFSVSLLVNFLDFGADSTGHQTFLFHMGQMISSVYGICSLLIPAFLVISGCLCIYAKWSVKRGTMLLCSIVPFFTAVMTERICRKLAETEAGPLFTIKLVTALIIAGLVIGIEYLAAGILGEHIASKKSEPDIETVIEPVSGIPAEAETESVPDSAVEDVPQPENMPEESVLETADTEVPDTEITASDIPDADASDTDVQDEELSEEPADDSEAGTEGYTALDEPDEETEDASEVPEIPEAVKAEDTAGSAADNTDPSSKNGNQALDPDFFDIDMNAEDEDELEAAKEQQPSSGIADVFADMDEDVRKEAGISEDTVAETGIKVTEKPADTAAAETADAVPAEPVSEKSPSADAVDPHKDVQSAADTDKYENSGYSAGGCKQTCSKTSAEIVQGTI